MKYINSFFKIIIIFILHFSFALNASGQELMRILHSCSFDGKESIKEYYVDDPSKEAILIVEKIMRANVLPQNFIVKSAACKNALATIEGGKRYILYNTTFLENFKKEANTKWAAYCVLAHEIGHHLSNHDLTEPDPKKRKLYELQADKFAGGVLFRLGATLEEAKSGINTFTLDAETATHPAKSARNESVAAGWKQAQEMTQDGTNEPESNKRGYFGSISTQGTAVLKKEFKEFNQDYKIIFAKSVSSLKKMKNVLVTRSDIYSGIIEAEKSASSKSFGEKITIYITELESNRCKVFIISDCTNKDTLVDWGVNKNNIKSFFEGL